MPWSTSVSGRPSSWRCTAVESSSASRRRLVDRPAGAAEEQGMIPVVLRSVSVLTTFALLMRAPVATAAGRPLAASDLLAMHRISDPRISPDGTRVLYTVATPEMADNRLARDVWVVPLTGGEPKALTTTGRDGGARWSPDGRRIAYASARSGSMQLWLMNADGGDQKQITTVSGGVDNIVWAPDGRTIAFTSEVYLDCADDACNVARDKAREANTVKARVYDRLLYRHWSAWSEGKRTHLF